MHFSERDIYANLDRSTYPPSAYGEFRWRRWVMLCVVALYWDQTESERVHKNSILKNDRGYTQSDAPKATEWAHRFLRNVPIHVDTVQQLLELQPNDLKLIPTDSLGEAVTMLGHYRKQLSNKLNELMDAKNAQELSDEINKRPVVDDISRKQEKMNINDLQPRKIDDDIDHFSRFEKAGQLQFLPEAIMGKYKKPDYLKQAEAKMRDERIQQMKKPTIIPDKTKYDRKEIKHSCEME